MTSIEILGTILGIIGAIGTALSIYQWAQINASKERLREVQFLLASIHSSALSKQIAWQNQLPFYANPTDENDKKLLRTHLRARDDFIELSNLISAMEGAISAHDSAITEVMKKATEQSRLNNQLQQESLRNPTLTQSN